MNKRIFLAVKVHPEPELLDVFDLLRNELTDEQIRWVNEDQLHITLKFFGGTDESLIKEIAAAVKDCCLWHGRVSFGLLNPWYFRKHGQPAVLLLKTSETDALTDLQRDLENRFAGLDIPKEEKTFRPHLTLGRIRTLRDTEHFYKLMKQLPQRVLQIVPVNELILFESILKPSGPEYRILERFKLAGD